MTLVSVTPTFSLVLLAFVGLLLHRSAVMAAAVSLFGLLTSSSLSVLFATVTGLSKWQDLIMIVVTILVGLTMLVIGGKPIEKPRLGSWLGVLGFVLYSISIQIASRLFGLSSVAFTDGHTILLLGQEFQDGGDSRLSGIGALKRGFALPALQAFGQDGEYLVGFMPVFFLAALVLTLYLLREVASSIRVFFQVGAIVLVAVFSTEAILRHAYLINTHSIAWLAMAFFLTMLMRHLRGELLRPDFASIALVVTSISFTRLDLALLFAPITVALVLVAAPISRRYALAIVGAVIFPLWLWISIATTGFPYGGQFGIAMLSISGLLLGGLVVLIQGSSRRPLNILESNWLYLGAAMILALTILVANVFNSIQHLFVNLFLGEGLWGFTPLVLGVLALLSVFLGSAGDTKKFLSVSLKILAITLATYIFTKYLDGATAGVENPTFARIGFGDSLNRSLITWLPFAFFPLPKLFAWFDNRRSLLSRKEKLS
jgi:hypothetical protein